VFVLIPEGYVALGAVSAGIALWGRSAIKNFDQALKIVREMAETYPVTLVNSVNPYRLEGQKTAAFEIVEALGDAPDWLCIPVGNANNSLLDGILPVPRSRAMQSLAAHDGLQAAGASPLITGQPVANPDTVATAIRIAMLTGNGRSQFNQQVLENLTPSPMLKF